MKKMFLSALLTLATVSSASVNAAICDDAATAHNHSSQKSALKRLHISADTAFMVSVPYIAQDGTTATRLLHSYHGNVVVDYRGLKFTANSVDFDVAKRQLSSASITYYGPTKIASSSSGDAHLDETGTCAGGCQFSAASGILYNNGAAVPGNIYIIQSSGGDITITADGNTVVTSYPQGGGGGDGGDGSGGDGGGGGPSCGEQD